MRAIIYCRVSTVEQTDNLSLTTQEEAARDYCAHQDWEVDQVFIERGESAKTAQRTQLQALLRYCKKAKGRVQFLVVYSLSRLARNAEDHYALTPFLRDCGITLRSVTETIDGSPSGRFTEGVLALVAQLDNDVRSERVTTGMKASITRGKWVFPAPLGYTSVAGALALDPVTAPLVRHAFELCASGRFTIREVLAEVTRKGLRSRFGGKLSFQGFGYILYNPFYVGRLRVKTWDLTVQGSHPPLVSQHVFDRAQLVLAGRRPVRETYLRQNPDFPLRRFVCCGECGEPLTGSWAQGRTRRYPPYYWCSAKSCRGVKSRQERLQDEFVAYLDGLRPRREYLALFREVITAAWSQRDRKAQEFRTALDAKVQDLERRQERLFTAFVYKAAIEETDFRRETAKLKKEKELAEAELRLAKAPVIDIGSLLTFAEHVAGHAGELWRSGSLDQRIQLQRTIFPQGVTHLNEAFRTARIAMFFNNLPPDENAEARMVDPSLLPLNQLESWLDEIASLRKVFGESLHCP